MEGCRMKLKLLLISVLCMTGCARHSEKAQTIQQPNYYHEKIYKNMPTNVVWQSAIPGRGNYTTNVFYSGGLPCRIVQGDKMRVRQVESPATEAIQPRLARGREFRLLTPGKDYAVVTGDHVKATGHGRVMPTVGSSPQAGTGGLRAVERNSEQ